MSFGDDFKQWIPILINKINTHNIRCEKPGRNPDWAVVKTNYVFVEQIYICLYQSIFNVTIKGNVTKPVNWERIDRPIIMYVYTYILNWITSANNKSIPYFTDVKYQLSYIYT